jgi:beta-lactamase class D
LKENKISMKKSILYLQLISYFFLIISLAACSVNKANIDNELKTYYDAEKTEGCFTLLDNATGQITVYNMAMDTTRVSPGATFDILNAMIALHTGSITDENKPLGIQKENDSLAGSTTSLKQAFHDNLKECTQLIASTTGNIEIQKWIDSLSYGNKTIGDSSEMYWANNKLKISPDEQLGLLKHLYFDQLPFRKSVQESVRNMMLQEDNSAYRLSYKTASIINESNHTETWNIGWIEENRHVYFFVNLIKNNSSDKAPEQTAVKVTKNILSHYGFFKGLK